MTPTTPTVTAAERSAGPLLWIARVSGTAIAALLIAMLAGPEGMGAGRAPTVAEWVYLAFFPLGFSAGYLIGWRWPVAGGGFSLACMAISLAVARVPFDWQPYVIWGLLSVPGVLYVLGGRRARRGLRSGRVPDP